MTEKQALEYINNIAKRGSVPGLDAIFSMLEKTNSPQNTFKVIHVTGTNGKGSFCAMLSEILMKCNLTVGVFSSPFLLDIREMITVNGEMIDMPSLVRLTERLSQISESLPTPLTQFEFMTALCFEFFKESKVDIAVVEVGMGGRLDATNVFTSPLLSVITGISVDHTSFLGNTVEEIAFEKSGIIKKDCPVYYGGVSHSGKEIVKNKASQLNAPYYEKSHQPEINSAGLGKTKFSYKGNSYILSLAGEYQVENASKVIDCCDILNTLGLDIEKRHIDEGFLNVKRAARFEVISAEPPVIYDGGHNPECAEALVKSVKACLGSSPVHIIMGVLADKDYKKMVEIVSEIALRVYTITPNNPRALDKITLASEFRKIGIPAFPCEGYRDALENWHDDGGGPLIVTGSLYSYAEFIDAYNGINK